MAAGQPYMVSVNRTRRFSVTIPATGGVAATVESLVAAVAISSDAADLSRVMGCKIDALLTVGTDRPAIVVGDSAGSLLQYVGAGKDALEPSINEYRSTFVKSAAAAITAVVVLYIG